MNLINALAHAALSLENDLIEQACEAALQGGQHGVLVRRDARLRLVSAAPDRSVPYGVIHERRDG